MRFCETMGFILDEMLDFHLVLCPVCMSRIVSHSFYCMFTFFSSAKKLLLIFRINWLCLTWFIESIYIDQTWRHFLCLFKSRVDFCSNFTHGSHFNGWPLCSSLKVCFGRCNIIVTQMITRTMCRFIITRIIKNCVYDKDYLWYCILCVDYSWMDTSCSLLCCTYCVIFCYYFYDYYKF